MSTATTINQNSRVTLHFAVKMADGSVLISTFDKQPATLVPGDGNLMPAFEEPLLGLAVNDKKTFTIEQGFGEWSEQNQHRFPPSQFAHVGDLQVGMMLSFGDPHGGERPGVISKLTDELVTVDFNHPLAGKTLLFDVEIVAIEPVDPSKIVVQQQEGLQP